VRDVEAFDKGGAAAERQKAGEHFDDGGFFRCRWGRGTRRFRPFSTREADVVDGGEVAETPNQMFGGGWRLAGRACGWVAIASALGFQFHVRGHAGEDATGGIIDADFLCQ